MRLRSVLTPHAHFRFATLTLRADFNGDHALTVPDIFDFFPASVAPC